MLHINWYDVSKDFAGPIITAFSTIVALYLGLHKSNPKLDILSYKYKNNDNMPGVDKSNADTIIEFCLLKGDLGWFKLSKINYVCGKHSKTIFLNVPGNDPLGSISFSELNSRIVLSSFYPVHKIRLSKKDIIDEISVAQNDNVFMSYASHYINPHLELFFITNKSKHIKSSLIKVALDNK